MFVANRRYKSKANRPYDLRSLFAAGPRYAGFLGDPDNFSTQFTTHDGSTNITGSDQATGRVEPIAGAVELTQSVSADRPTSAEVPRGGVTNLFAETGVPSEDLTSAKWAKTGATAPSAGALQASSGSSSHRAIPTAFTTASSDVLVFKFRASQGTHPYLQIAISSQAADFVNIDLSDGTEGSGGGTYTLDIEDAGGGEYDITFTYTAGGTGRAPFIVIVEDASSARDPTWNAAGTETINASLFQVNLTTEKPYQKVTSAAVITEAGVPSIRGWYFDGGDDSFNGTFTSADFEATGASIFGWVQIYNPAPGADEYYAGLYGSDATAHFALAVQSSNDKVALKYQDDAGGGVVTVEGPDAAFGLHYYVMYFDASGNLVLWWDGTEYTGTMTPDTITLESFAVGTFDPNDTPSNYSDGIQSPACIFRAITASEIAQTNNNLASLTGV